MDAHCTGLLEAERTSPRLRLRELETFCAVTNGSLDFSFLAVFASVEGCGLLLLSLFNQRHPARISEVLGDEILAPSIAPVMPGSRSRAIPRKANAFLCRSGV